MCDDKMCIRYMNARHGGASHDSAIWEVSALKDFLKNNFEMGDKDSIILGIFI